jgi:hypothetical protein
MAELFEIVTTANLLWILIQSFWTTWLEPLLALFAGLGA